MTQRDLADAERLLSLNRPREATDLARRCVAADPDSGPALLVLARALDDLEQHDEAVSAARRAVSLMPDSAHAHVVHSVTLIGAKDADGAVAAAQHAVGLAPWQWNTHYSLAHAMISGRRPRYRDAYDVAVHAVGLAPNEPDPHNLVGLCLDRLGNSEGARVAYQNALRLDPEHAIAMNNLATVDLDAGRLGRAAQGLRRTLGIDPQARLSQRNLDLVVVKGCHRLFLVLLGAAIVIGIEIAAAAPWWVRGATGVALLSGIGMAARRFATHLPRGFGAGLPSLWRRVGWGARRILALFVFALGCVSFMAFAPREVGAAAGIGLLVTLQYVGVVMIIVWVVGAAVALVRKQ